MCAGGNGALDGELPFDEASVVGVRARAGAGGVRGEAAPVAVRVAVALPGEAGR